MKTRSSPYVKLKLEFYDIKTEVEGPEPLVEEIWTFLKDELLEKVKLLQRKETEVSKEQKMPDHTAATSAPVSPLPSSAPMSKRTQQEKEKQAESRDKPNVQKEQKEMPETPPESPDKQKAQEIIKIPFDRDLKVFVDKKKPDTRVKWTLVFAYYLKHKKGKPFFSAKDIGKCYRSINMTPPPRYSQDIHDGIKKYGYFSKSEKERGLYEITDKGEQVVDVMGQNSLPYEDF